MDRLIPLKPKHADEPHFSCPACKDEGVPARVLTIDAATSVATVYMNGGEAEVALDLLDDVQVGDFILVHLDTAIAKLNPADVVEQ